jgi:UDP-2,3-diacylglucosamine pyrophosphatase LpxH
MERRPIDILVLSDIHLGTVGCHAKELHTYINSIDPGLIILNGDIIDIWQFRKNYWPASHMKVVKKLLSWLSQGKAIYYITGNHDELLRKFSPTRLGNLHIKNKLLLQMDEGPAWFFHGDVFDLSMKYSKWLARLGAVGYDLLILMNRWVNWFAASLGYGRISLSKKIKDGVKTAVRFISDFEQIAIDLAAEKGYAYVVCGHIHQPNIRQVPVDGGQLTYLNSGDWIENLTALEYYGQQWHLYRHTEQMNLNGDQHKERAGQTVSDVASAQTREEVEGVSLETEMLHGTGQPEEEVFLAQLIQQVTAVRR